MIYVVLMDRGLKRSTYRNSSNIHAERVFTFLVGEPSVHELDLLALYSQVPTFKTEFTFQILTKKKQTDYLSAGLGCCLYLNINSCSYQTLLIP